MKDKEDTVVYYTEELVAQILKYGRTLAETQADGLVKECVLTIPSYFTQEQRRMMNDAADLAGLKVISMVHENVAAATMFGIDRVDDEPITVLFYNMGAKDTEVAVVKY